MTTTPRDPREQQGKVNRNVLAGAFIVIVLFVAAFAGGGAAGLFVALVGGLFVRARNRVAREQAEHRHAWGDW